MELKHICYKENYHTLETFFSHIRMLKSAASKIYPYILTKIYRKKSKRHKNNKYLKKLINCVEKLIFLFYHIML